MTKGLYWRSGWHKLGILPSSVKPYLSNLTEQWQNYTTLINFSFFINCKLFAITWETISLCFFIEGIMIIAGQLKGLFDYNTKEYSGYSNFGQLVNWMVHLGTEYKASNYGTWISKLSRGEICVSTFIPPFWSMVVQVVF